MSAFPTVQLPYSTDQQTIEERKDEHYAKFDEWVKTRPFKLSRSCKNSIRGRINNACVSGEEVLDFGIYKRDWELNQMTYGQKWPVRKLKTIPNNFKQVEVGWGNTQEFVSNVQVDNYQEFKELFDKNEDENIIRRLYESNH